jgi:pimeloyl-ACP methyl ester carboxylesterase
MMTTLAARLESACGAWSRASATHAPLLEGERRIVLPSATVRVLQAGRGSRVIVLVPDPPNVIEHHREVIRDLAKDHLVYAFEMVGFGHSRPHSGFAHDLDAHRRVLSELFAELDLEHVTLSIACLSGLVGATFAALEPELVARLVLLQVPSVEQAGHWARRTDRLGMIRTPLAGQLFTWAARRAILRHWYRVALPEPMDTERYRALLSPSELALDAGAAFALASAYQTLSRARVVFPRETPQLHLWGAADRTHHETLRRDALLGLARAEYVECPGIGHFPDLEQPTHYTALVRDFEARHRPA